MRSLIILFFLLLSKAASCSIIHGYIKNTSGFRFKVSLFHLRNADEFHSVSNRNLLATTITDTAGVFKLEAEFIPEEEIIYRINIRIIKNESDLNTESIELGKGKLFETNYIFLALKGSSNITLEMLNDSNIIFQHYINPTDPLGGLYKIIKEYNQEVDSLNKSFETRLSTFSGSNSEINTLKNENTSLVKKKLSKNLKYFLNLTTNVNAAVLSYSVLMSINGFHLETGIAAYKRIKLLNENSIYLQDIYARLQAEQKNERLIFYRRLSIVSCTLVLLFIATSAVLFIKYRNNKRRLTELASANIQRDIRSLLSKKEVEIFEMLSQGLSNKEIATAQYLELSTVKKHISNIYAKTGIKNRKEAAEQLKKEER